MKQQAKTSRAVAATSTALKAASWVPALVLALAVCIAVVMLPGCSGQSASSQSGAASEAGQSGAASASQSAAVPGSGQTSGIDVANLKTFADCLALGTVQTASWDDSHYIAVIDANGAPLRVVADITPEISEQISSVDFSKDDHDAQLAKVLEPLAVASAEDLSVGVPAQADLDAFVGKTGQDVFDAGYEFSTYFMYGGEQTIATFEQGNYAINVTFDGTVPESQTSDGGDAVKSLPVEEVEYAGVSDRVTDPTLLK